MKKFAGIFIIITLCFFLIGASPPPKRYPAQTGTYKVEKSNSKSSAKGVGGICFIATSQY